MIGREKCFAVLERALQELERAGAKGACARLSAGASALTRFANNHVHQNVVEEDASLSLVAVIGKKGGSTSTNRLDRNGIAACAKQAVNIARQAADDPELPGFVEASPAPEVPEAYDPKTAALAPSARARLAAKAAEYAAKNGVVASGKVSSGAAEIAFANSAGARQYAAGTAFGAACTGMVDGAAGSEDWSGTSVAQVEKHLGVFGRVAADTALAARRPRRIEPGDWPVILAPRAVSTLIDFLSYLGFDAQAHLEGRSCLAGKMGTKIASNKITLRDDGLSPEGMALPFDFEGLPRKPLMLIDAGIARELPHNSRTAKKMSAAPTGHSFGLLNPHGGLPMHMVMQPGEATLESMVASMPKGLLVSRFWYTNVAEPAKAVLTGMTRDGLFYIENGRIAGPVCNLRFTESILDALSRVELVGSELQSVGGEWDSGLTRVPALKLGAFRFTGATEF